MSSAAPVSDRESWQEECVVEVFSATANRWYPATVVLAQTGPDGQDILTVRFYMDDEAKQKSMLRSDAHLASLGTYTAGELPPGFKMQPSQSRQGQMVYLDATTGVKYAT